MKTMISKLIKVSLFSILSILLFMTCVENRATNQQSDGLQGTKWQLIQITSIDSIRYYSCISCIDRYDSSQISLDTTYPSDTTTYFFIDSDKLVIFNSTIKTSKTIKYSIEQDTISFHFDVASSDSLIQIPILQLDNSILTLDESAYYYIGKIDTIGMSPPDDCNCKLTPSKTISLRRIYTYKLLQ